MITLRTALGLTVASMAAALIGTGTTVPADATIDGGSGTDTVTRDVTDPQPQRVP